MRLKLAHNQSFAQYNNKSHQYLLRALVSCGDCLSACIARTVLPANQYYICSAKAKAEKRHREECCQSRFIPAGQLDEVVWRDLCELMMNPQRIAQALARAQAGEWWPQELHARRGNLRKGRVSLEQQLNRLTEAYLNGVIPLDEYKSRGSALEQRRHALDNQAQQLQAQADRQGEVAGMIRSLDTFCQRVRTGLETVSFE